MEIIETYDDSPKPQGASEDRLVVTDDFIAVLDGAGSQKKGLPDGKSSGWHAAEKVAEVIKSMPVDVDVDGFVKLATQALQPLTVYCDEKNYRPATQALIFSKKYQEIWRIGDSHFRLNDQIYIGDKVIDAVGVHFRCALFKAFLKSGEFTVEQLMGERELSHRPWRALVEYQGYFQNLDDPTEPLAYGVLDGTPVPKRFVTTVQVEAGTEVVFCTDGFVTPYPSLEQGLSEMTRLQKEDPLLIFTHPGSRSFYPGKPLFDDIAYIRFKV